MADQGKIEDKQKSEDKPTSSEDKPNNDQREAPPQQKLDTGLYSKKLESFVQRIDLIIQEVSTTMYTSNPGLNANLENALARLIEAKFWLINLRTIVTSQQPKEEKSPIVSAH